MNSRMSIVAANVCKECNRHSVQDVGEVSRGWSVHRQFFVAVLLFHPVKKLVSKYNYIILRPEASVA